VEVIREEITLSPDQIQKNLDRTYQEMEKVSISSAELTKVDYILRLAEYYEQLHSIGAFVDQDTGRIKSLNEVSRTIIDRMNDHNISKRIQWYVPEVLPDKYKRAWRQPITINGKLQDRSLLVIDTELTTIYDSYAELISKLDKFDYNELPKRMQLELAEKVYKLYRHHDKEWSKHDLQIVKHEDGFNIPDPYAGIIRIYEGKPYTGMAVNGVRQTIKLLKEIEKKYTVNIYGNDEKRKITLDQEKQIYNGWMALCGYLKPSANDKWKRDFLGWAKILKRRIEIKSKSGAAKFSRKDVEIDGIIHRRGVTREEINKNQLRMIDAYKKFMTHMPALIELHNSFEWLLEPVRAAHSVRMHGKLSQSS
jgi:hypothetical protein